MKLYFPPLIINILLSSLNICCLDGGSRVIFENIDWTVFPIFVKI